jgi:indolepyruvate ferredoxin oxidoreductase alpha subunit
MPAVMELRIRACHVRGSFTTRSNVAPRSTRDLIAEPAGFDYMRLAHPPVTFRHEKLKVEQRIPAAQPTSNEHGLNERFDGDLADLGLSCRAACTTALMRALQLAGLADAAAPRHADGAERHLPAGAGRAGATSAAASAPCWCWRKAPRVHREGPRHPLRRQDLQTPVHGKDLLPAGRRVHRGGDGARAAGLPGTPPAAVDTGAARSLAGRQRAQRRADVAKALGAAAGAPAGLLHRLPRAAGVLALKLAQQEVGPVHVAADIGCHALRHLRALFQLGHTILGYGMSLASRAGVSPMMQRRVLSVMGDGGFWHNGLLTGVQSALFNGDDAVLVIMKNGYTSATGTQDILNTPDDEAKAEAERNAALHQSLAHKNQTIEATLKGMGVQWLRVVHTYEVAKMRARCRRRFTSDFNGLKVIVAEGECQLERQRRIKPWIAGR